MVDNLPGAKLSLSFKAKPDRRSPCDNNAAMDTVLFRCEETLGDLCQFVENMYGSGGLELVLESSDFTLSDKRLASRKLQDLRKHKLIRSGDVVLVSVVEPYVLELQVELEGMRLHSDVGCNAYVTSVYDDVEGKTAVPIKRMDRGKPCELFVCGSRRDTDELVINFYAGHPVPTEFIGNCTTGRIMHMMLGSNPITLENKKLSVNEALTMSRTKAGDKVFDYFAKNNFVRRYPLFPDAADGPQVKVTGNFRLFKEMVSVEVLWTDWVIEGRLDDNSFNDFSSRLTLTQKLSSVDKQGQTRTTTPRGLAVEGEKLQGVKCGNLDDVTVKGIVGTYEDGAWVDTAGATTARNNLSIRDLWGFELSGLQLLRIATATLDPESSKLSDGSSVVTIDLLDRKMYSSSTAETCFGHVYTSAKDVASPLALTAAAAIAAGVSANLRDPNSKFWKTKHSMFKSLPEFLEFWYRYKPHEIAQKWQAHFQGDDEDRTGPTNRKCMEMGPKVESFTENDSGSSRYRGSRLMSAADFLRQLRGGDEAIIPAKASAMELALLEQNTDLKGLQAELCKLAPCALVAVHGRGNHLRFHPLPRHVGTDAAAGSRLQAVREFVESEYKVFAVSMKSQVQTSSMREEDFLESNETVDDDVLLRWASSRLVVPKVKLRVSINTIWRPSDSIDEPPCCPAESKWCFCMILASLLLFAVPLVVLYSIALFDGKSRVDVMFQSSIPVITATRQGGTLEMDGKIVYSVKNEGLLPLCVDEVIANLFYVRDCKKQVCLRRRVGLGQYDIRVPGDSAGLVDPSGPCLARGQTKQYDIDFRVRSSLDEAGVEELFKDCYADSMFSLNFDGAVDMDWKWSSLLTYLPLDDAKILHSEVVPCIPSVSLVQDSGSFMERAKEEEKLDAEPTPQDLAYLAANKAQHDIAIVEESRKIRALAAQNAEEGQLVLNPADRHGDRRDRHLNGK